MAVSLDVDLSQSSYDAATNTSTVTATVIINHTAGSYNGYNPSGTLMINGQSYDFSSNFNYADGGPISTNGSTVAYTTTITVPHNDDGSADIYASATFDSGVSSGTVIKYAATVLNGSGSGSGSGGSGSGSGSGSDGSGSGSGSGSDGNNPEVNWGPYVIGVSKSDTVELLICKENGEIVPYGSLVPLRTKLCISCKADAGYRISTFTINNVKYNTDENIWITVYTDQNIIAKTIREGEFYQVNVTQIGDFSLNIMTPDPDDANRYISLQDGDYVKAGANITAMFPSGTIFVCNGTQVSSPNTYWYGTANQDINIVASIGNNARINVSQGENTSLIIRRKDNDTAIKDGSLLPVGTEIVIYFVADDDYKPMVSLNSEWVDTSYGGLAFVLEKNTNIISTAVYVPPVMGFVYIDNGTTFVPYQIFIDNGANWDQYVLHIDDGTIWYSCN